jgi:RHS repeat-associated protein
LEAETGLYFYSARWYDPGLGRFIQPDPIIPEPHNSLAYDRYQYVYSNPIRYTDSSGHCIDGITTWACIIIIGGVVLKAVDYGWTAYDAWQAGRIITDPNASPAEKDAATVTLALTIGFEAAEPDELSPISLPLDDLARKGLIKLGKETGEGVGEQVFKSFTYWNFRENLQRLTKKAWMISRVWKPTMSYRKNL